MPSGEPEVLSCPLGVNVSVTGSLSRVLPVSCQMRSEGRGELSVLLSFEDQCGGSHFGGSSRWLLGACV